MELNDWKKTHQILNTLSWKNIESPKNRPKLDLQSADNFFDYAAIFEHEEPTNHPIKFVSDGRLTTESTEN